MLGLSLLDILVIILYFAVIIGIGVWSSRRIRSQEDFFLAGRGLGKLVQTFAAFGQATSGQVKTRRKRVCTIMAWDYAALRLRAACSV